MDLRLGLHRPAPARRSCGPPHWKVLRRGLRSDLECNAHRGHPAFGPGLRSFGAPGPSYRLGPSTTLQPALHGTRGGPQDREADQGPGEREQQADYDAVGSHVVFPFNRSSSRSPHGWRRLHHAVIGRWISRCESGDTDLLIPKRHPPHWGRCFLLRQRFCRAIAFIPEGERWRCG